MSIPILIALTVLILVLVSLFAPNRYTLGIAVPLLALLHLVSGWR